MLQDSGVAVGTRPAAEAPPELAGWAGAATAVHACQQMAVPMTLRLDVAGHDVIAIDFAFNAYEWSVLLDDFPATPGSVLVETRPGRADAPTIELPGQPLDPLLWSIGINAFGGEPAPWLVPGNRYRLRRWPSLTAVPVDLDQVRMIAMLGNAFATADELASAAQTTREGAIDLINALSIAGLLRRSAGAPALDAAAQLQMPTASGTTGLFARLRRKWGR